MMNDEYTRIGRKGVAAGAMLLTGALLGYTAAPDAKSTATGPAAVAAREAGAIARTLGPATHTYANVVEAVTPAVVTVRSERRVRQVSQQVPDDLLRDFFGGRVPMPQRPQPRAGGLGSGVIVRADGYILTNHHVIDGAEQVTVELTDGRSFKADVVGSDAPSDLAVLKIAGASNLQTLSLGNSDAVAVGDVVLAVGNPLGVGQTVTMGIVSAKGRATGGTSFEDFIQTDAPINQGNSGGALVNTDGELVGINSQILSPSGGNIGIGFSIPANMARNVMTQLIDQGTVRRGMLGVTIQPVTSDIARSLGLTTVRGALVNGVAAGQPGRACRPEAWRRDHPHQRRGRQGRQRAAQPRRAGAAGDAAGARSRPRWQEQRGEGHGWRTEAGWCRVRAARRGRSGPGHHRLRDGRAAVDAGSGDALSTCRRAAESSWPR